MDIIWLQPNRGGIIKIIIGEIGIKLEKWTFKYYVNIYFFIISRQSHLSLILQEFISKDEIDLSYNHQILINKKSRLELTFITIRR